MRSFLCAVALLGICLPGYAASKETITFNVTRPADKLKTEFTACGLNNLYIALSFGYESETDLATALTNGDVVFHAKQGETTSWYATSTSGEYGHWFTTKGIAVKNGAKTAVVMGRYEDGEYYVAHDPSKLAEGDVVTFRQAFIRDTDTLLYQVNLTIGQAESVTTDQPSKEETFIHRKDYTDDWQFVPRVRRNEQAYLYQNYIQVKAGESFSLAAEALKEDAANGYYVKFQFRDPNGKVLNRYGTEDVTVTDAEYADAGMYKITVRRMDTDDKIVSIDSYYYFVDVQEAEEGAHYDWAANTPKFSYNFRDEYPDLEAPTKTHTFKKKDGTLSNQVVGEWWSAHWGDNLNAEVGGDEYNAFTNMVKKFDEDFAYIRDNMGWPPDKSPKYGYRSFIYVFGSGLANDNTSSTEMGGYQGYTNADGDGWPCVWASYYPVARFRDDADQKWSDGDYQREAMIHEGIHAVLADMPGVKDAAWFHEGGNTWLQAAMSTERYGVTGTPGFLDACQFIAPFQPIECYSGWLQDGSFGGPSAEGVNMFQSDGAQVCTWRNLLGGTQYGNGFPITLAHIVGKGAIPWIWRYCPKRVLEGIADSIGEESTRSLIMQYRARQATFDIGVNMQGYRSVTHGNLGATIKAEWSPYWINVAPYKVTPYQTLTRNSRDGWLAPEQITTPGWSGGNIIPIHVSPESNMVKVEFRPEDLNMRAQLCYRTKSGKTYYSYPVHCGTLSLDISDRPANGVIFCVVANTDHVYEDKNYEYYGESLRKHHFDYRIKLGAGALAIADRYKPWYFFEQTITDEAFVTGIEDVKYGETINPAQQNNIRLMTSVIKGGEVIQTDLNGVDANDVKVRIVGLSGIIVESGNLEADGSFIMPAVRPGMYFITMSHGSQRDVFKCIVK